MPEVFSDALDSLQRGSSIGKRLRGIAVREGREEFEAKADLYNSDVDLAAHAFDLGHGQRRCDPVGAGLRLYRWRCRVAGGQSLPNGISFVAGLGNILIELKRATV